MNRIVLDASVLLAILHEEPGAEIFTTGRSNLLEHSIMSAVNVSEAHAKLVGLGIDSEDAWEAVSAPIPEIVDFDRSQAKIAGGLLSHTRSLGLSLGDRACLSLGIALKVPVYTADRAWKNLKLKIPIHTIR